MSIKFMALVWQAGPEKQAERFVLLALADFANDDGESWPAIAGVAKKTCLSERGVRQIIRALEDGEWITTRLGGGRGGANVYRINPERYAPFTAENPEPAAPIKPINPEPAAAPPGTSFRPPRHITALNPERGAPEPSRTIIEPSVEKKARATLAACVRPETADAFIAYRKSKRSPLTAHAAELIVKAIRESPDPDAVLELSIMNGWTGVFPQKVTDSTKGNSHGKPSKSAISLAAFIGGASRTS